MIPPETFSVVDIKDSPGPVVHDGDCILLMYKAALSEADLDAGRTIESTYQPDYPIAITVRNDELLYGVYKALLGMHTGGAIRRVAFGCNLAFGDRAWGPIPAGAGLVIELCVSRIIQKTEDPESCDARTTD